MYAFCPAAFEYNWAIKGYIKFCCVELTNQPRRLITVNIQRFISLAHMKSTVGPGALLGSQLFHVWTRIYASCILQLCLLKHVSTQENWRVARELEGRLPAFKCFGLEVRPELITWPQLTVTNFQQGGWRMWGSIWVFSEKSVFLPQRIYTSMNR